MSSDAPSAPDLVRIVVADDDPDIRLGLREILDSVDDLSVVGEAEDGAIALQLIAKLRPDVALLDIRMPVLDGLGVAGRLTQQPTAVIIVTTFGEAAYVDRAVELGVAGFLLKTGGPAELVAGVRAVARGGTCLSPAIAHQVMRDLRSARAAARTIPSRQLPDLTARQRELLERLAKGHTNAEIAIALHLSEGTVKAYLRELFVKLGVRNRVEAAILAGAVRQPTLAPRLTDPRPGRPNASRRGRPRTPPA